jgi:undecaprenyl-diphosphatase
MAVWVYLLVVCEWRTALYWLGTVVVGIVIASAVKLWVRVPRPLELYEGISVYAFPSAHVTTVCVVLTFFAVIVTGPLRRYRGLPYTFVVGIVFGVAVSRLYLGAHWLSDVLGGIALALAWVSAVGLTYRQHCAPLRRIWPIVVVACTTGLAAASWHLYQHFDAELSRYTPHATVTPQIDEQAWWQSEWAALPVQRIDIRGKPSTPLNVQYAGDLDALRTMLEQRGWNVPSHFTMQSTLLWFNPNADVVQLPVLPNVNDQRHESFRMVLNLNSQHRIVLRLWNGAMTTGATPGLIYVGTVTQETLVELLHTVRFAKAGSDNTHALNVFQAFVAEWPHKKVPRAGVHDPELRWQWDGQTLLLRQGAEGLNPNGTNLRKRHSATTN